MKKNSQSIILCPLITEKATLLRDKDNKYAFKVANYANKNEVKKAIEELFKVDVKSVNVMNVLGKIRRIRGKAGKKPDWKKAIITLEEGKKIDITGL